MGLLGIKSALVTGNTSFHKRVLMLGHLRVYWFLVGGSVHLSNILESVMKRLGTGLTVTARDLEEGRKLIHLGLNVYTDDEGTLSHRPHPGVFTDVSEIPFTSSRIKTSNFL